ANAGSEPPLICRGPEIIKPRVEGVPAGMLDHREYEELTYDAQPGDLVLLNSDGITDQLNPREEQFGRGHLIRSLRRQCNEGAQAVADGILADLDQFTAGAPAFDDQTIMVLKVR
ncbi:MAG TPA: PP2C family protein-serine/threonine phosphatase, partial [Bryobacteraceae bacterium]